MEYAIGLLLLCIAGHDDKCIPAAEASMRIPELRIYVEMAREDPELVARLPPNTFQWLEELGEL